MNFMAVTSSGESNLHQEGQEGQSGRQEGMQRWEEGAGLRAGASSQTRDSQQ